jgi:cytidylate kinase
MRNVKRGVAMAVITVSRQLGSLGTEIAQKVAEVLQYEFVDKEKIGMTLAGLEGVRRVNNQLLVTEHYRFGG